MTAKMRLDGYSIRPLHADDTALLQDLFERCSDFNELTEGVPTRATAAEEELASIPPNAAAEDQFLFGVAASDDAPLAGVLTLSRHFPKRGEWWLGLLMLAPEARGAGLGRRLVEGAIEWVREQGGTMLWLGVLVRNEGAERFWRARGFKEHSRQIWTAPTGLTSEMVLMRRPTA